MIKFAVTRDEEGFQVWAMLDDPAFNADPTARGESFIVGQGATQQRAFLAAKEELERGVELLDFASQLNEDALAKIVATGMLP